MEGEGEGASPSTLGEERDITEDKTCTNGGADEDAPTKIKIKSLNTLVGDKANNAQNKNIDFTIGDILEHGDFVSSDESGVMHLKITNVMSVDESNQSITGCTISEDDKDAFANIQIANVTTLLDEDPAASSSEPSTKDATDDADAVTSTASTESLTVTTTTTSTKPSLKIVNISSLKSQVNTSTANGSAMCVVPRDATNEQQTSDSKPAATARIYTVIRSSLVVPRTCQYCFKNVVCEYRALLHDERDTSKKCLESSYLCSLVCKNSWQSYLPSNFTFEKPRKCFERVCGMCGNDIIDNNGLLFSWETREFCNKLCLADHIGYVGQKCRQCQSSVRLLHMGKYCVRFGSDIYQFCSNTCLERYKVNIQVCCYCQKNLLEVSAADQRLIITVNNNKKYCSNKCQRRALRKDINQQYYTEKKNCTVCMVAMVPRFEFLKDNESSFLCSQPCLNVYKFANNYRAVNCCLCLRLLCVESVIHFLYHNNGQLRVFCSVSCTNVFIISTRRIVTCCFCKVKKYNFDMIHLHDVEPSYYCSVCCLNMHKQKTNIEDVTDDVPSSNASSATLPALPAPLPCPAPPATDGGVVTTPAVLNAFAVPVVPPIHVAAKPATLAPPAPATTNAQLTNCNMCNNLSPAQFHMVMSDNTLRNFCSYPCASRYKVTYGFLVSNKGSQSKPNQVAKVTLPSQTASTVAKETKSNGTDNAAASLRSFRAIKNSAPGPRTIRKALSDDNNINSAADEKNDISKLLERIKESISPKPMVNKSVMCKPRSIDSTLTNSKELQKSQGSNTVNKDAALMPLPIPLCIPSPVVMYSMPTPTPVVLPVPVPIPVVLPAASDTVEQLLTLLEEMRKKYSKSGVEASSDDTEQCNAVLNDKGKKRQLESDDKDPDAMKKKMSKTENDFMSVWLQWVKAHNSSQDSKDDHYPEEIEAMPEPQMCSALTSLITTMKTPSGDEYKPDEVFEVLLGFQKLLFSKNKSICIFSGEAFKKLQEKLDCIISGVEENNLPPSLPHSLACVDEVQLWESGLIGIHSPHALLNAVFYFNTKFFNVMTVQQHKNLKFSMFSKDFRTNGTAIIKFSKEDEGSEPLVVDECTSDPLRCPVVMYDLYLSKCPRTSMEMDESFYLCPDERSNLETSLWYTNCSLSHQALRIMFNRTRLLRDSNV